MPDQFERMTQKEMKMLDGLDPEKPNKKNGGDALVEALSLLDNLEDQKERLESREMVKERRKFSEMMADRIAKIGGSWGFIITFVAVLIMWMALNTSAIILHWDPYPFILLNLCLSTVAALQAPIILMSQNRQANRDRRRDEIDFERDRLDLKVDTLAAKTIREATLRIAGMEATLKRLERKIDASRKRK